MTTTSVKHGALRRGILTKELLIDGVLTFRSELTRKFLRYSDFNMSPPITHASNELYFDIDKEFGYLEP